MFLNKEASGLTKLRVIRALMRRGRSALRRDFTAGRAAAVGGFVLTDEISHPTFTTAARI